MDMFENMWMFVCVVQVGSFFVVVKQIDVVIVQVLRVVVSLEVYVQICLLNWIIWKIVLIDSGCCYFECL